MYLKEQIIMNHIAFELIQYGNYEILHISEQNQEIWLEKYDQRISTVVRITTVGYDWKNELKRDISMTLQKVRSMGQLLVGKEIDIKNIYVSQYAPVDDWEVLKRPITYKSGKAMKMHVYYVNQEEYQKEIERISKDIFHISFPELNHDPKTLAMNLQNYQMFLNNAVIEKREKAERIFSHGKPTFTYILIAINVIYFIIIEMLGSSLDPSHLIQFGAKFNPLIMDHEWWRIISSMFIHVGFVHLFMNMLALFYLGTAVERIYGPWKFLLIYTLGGVSGGLASFAFTVNVSAGASGAIFGLFGALLFFGLHERKIFLQTIGREIIFLIAFNIIFGFIVPQIDNGAHLGGLFAGFISSAIVHLPNRRDVFKQLLATFGYIAISGLLIFIGFQNDENIASYNLVLIEEYLAEDQYQEVVDLVDRSLPLTDDQHVMLHLYFQRSIGYIGLEQYNSAIEDLEKTIEIDENFHKSYYNLALLYEQQNDIDKARKAIEIAYALDSNNPKYLNLYIEIIGKDPRNKHD